MNLAVEGKTILHHAAEAGETEVCSLILKHPRFDGGYSNDDTDDSSGDDARRTMMAQVVALAEANEYLELAERLSNWRV